MAWIQAGAALVGSYMGYRGAKDVNNAQMGMSREQMEWEERMSNTAMTRRVADLRKAGLNPMLGYSSQASTPSYQIPQLQNEKAILGNGISTAVQAKLQADNIKAQTAATEAQTRKTDAEARIVESSVPYSAQNAKVTSDTLQRNFEKLGEEVGQVMMQTKGLSLDNLSKSRNLEDYRDLVVEYQRLLNESEKAGLSEKQATAKFFETVPYAKWLELVKRILK